MGWRNGFLTCPLWEHSCNRIRHVIAAHGAKSLRERMDAVVPLQSRGFDGTGEEVRPFSFHNFSIIFPQLSHDFFAVGAYPLFRSQMACFDEEDCHDEFWFLPSR